MRRGAATTMRQNLVDYASGVILDIQRFSRASITNKVGRPRSCLLLSVCLAFEDEARPPGSDFAETARKEPVGFLQVGIRRRCKVSRRRAAAHTSTNFWSPVHKHRRRCRAREGRCRKRGAAPRVGAATHARKPPTRDRIKSAYHHGTYESDVEAECSAAPQTIMPIVGDVWAAHRDRSKKVKCSSLSVSQSRFHKPCARTLSCVSVPLRVDVRVHLSRAHPRMPLP